MDRKQQKLEEARKKLYAESLLYKNLFRTPDGKAVLADLKVRFMDRELSIGSSDEIIKKAAQHDVVQFIINMVNYEVKNG